MFIAGLSSFVWNSVRDYGVSCVSRVGVGDRLKFVSLDKISIGQVVVLSGLPFLYFYQPGLASVYIPMLCTALVISRLVQLWDNAEVEKNRAEQIKKLEEQNVRLQESFKGFEQVAKKLEQGLALCLGLKDKARELQKGEDEFNQAVESLEGRIAQKLEGLKDKVEILAGLCEKAHQERSTQILFNTVAQTEKQLESVQLEYDKRVLELGTLNLQFEEVKKGLRGVIDALAESNQRLKDKLIVLEQAMEIFIQRKKT